ncbi:MULTISPECIES: Holliday junction resolvase RuvX [Pelosinus]|uniref:Putative pre-16S rRNA nuclease n=2 Tax=Pelosinus TaxID=365348 RepID=I9NXU6_9FIRM|nr:MULTISPECIES: Holliday junction resolvase RuvX [Pelosinus]AJQ27805.1 Holliday junction resolvase [Pelosinus fermentans JBW45]MCC5467713.1 Holliday junction resolvase RuvX [Pelosinus baikalensis]
MRILALDVGDKTIGVAASDLLLLTAQGIEVIRRTSLERDLSRLNEIITEYEVGTILIGLPKNMNGSIGPRGELMQTFANLVAETFPTMKVVLWDERLSTVGAQKALIAADVSRAKRKKVIDKMAAVFILQGYLDSLSC